MTVITRRCLLIFGIVLSLAWISCSPTGEQEKHESLTDTKRETTDQEQTVAERKRARKRCRFHDTTGIYDPFVPTACIKDLRLIPWESIRILVNRPSDPVLIDLSDERPDCLGLFSTGGGRGREGWVVKVVGGKLKRPELCKRGAVPDVFRTYLAYTPSPDSNIIDGSTIPKVRKGVRIEARRHARRFE